MCIINNRETYVHFNLPSGARTLPDSRRWLAASNEYTITFEYPGLPEVILRNKAGLGFWMNQLYEAVHVTYVVRFPRIVSAIPDVWRISMRTAYDVDVTPTVAALPLKEDVEEKNIVSYLCFRAFEARKENNFK